VKRYYRILAVLLCFLGLVALRAFENQLFYDPYLVFFKNDYLYVDSPRREVAKLVFFTTLRYTINTLLSLGILWAVFRDNGIIKFSLLLYTMAYMVLISAYLFFVIHPRQEDYYLFFNVRRFLIQPLFIMLLLPAFYYYRLKR